MTEIGKIYLRKSIFPPSDFSKIPPFYGYLIGQKSTKHESGNENDKP